MDVLKKYGKDKAELKSKFKQAEQEMKIQQMLEERQKSSNERELERYVKQEREKQIKNKLDKIRKIKTKASWKDSSILDGGNKILNEDSSVLNGGKSILRQKHIFANNKNIHKSSKRGNIKW